MKIILNTIALISFFSLQALAASPESVIRKSQRVTSIVEREARHMRMAELERVDLLLDDVMNELRGRGDGGGGSGVLLRAVCHVDDDSSFDWNQAIAGDVQGLRVDDLLRDCAQMGAAMYRYSTTGILGVAIVGVVPRGSKGGTCHIDDDSSFDFGQIVIGELVGPDITSISNDCKTIANAVYGLRGSSGVKDFKSY